MKRPFGIIGLVSLFACWALAGDMTFTITRAELGCRLENEKPVPNMLYLIFDKSLNADELITCDDATDDKKCNDARKTAQDWMKANLLATSNYTLIQTDARVFGEFAEIVDLPPIPTPIQTSALDPARRNPTDYVLDNSFVVKIKTFELAKDYILLAKTTSQEKSVPAMVVVEKNGNCESFGNELPTAEDDEAERKKKEKEEWEKRSLNDFLTEPANKETPVLKFDFGLQGAKKQKALFSFDVKFRPYTTRRLGMGGHYEFTPFFVETVYNINAKEGDKKNVLNVGVAEFKLTKVFRDDGGEIGRAGIAKRYKHFPGMAFTLTPKMETEWRFKEVNFLLSPRAELPINLYQSRQTTLQVAPFVGIDLGIKTKSDDTKSGGWQIQRPFIGGKLTANFFRKKEKALFEIEVDYIRRLFLRPELSYGFDSNGKEIPDRASKRVREHAGVKVTWNAAELFSPFVQWEYGRVPPNYTLLNYSFKTGFVVNADLAWKAFR